MRIVSQVLAAMVLTMLTFQNAIGQEENESQDVIQNKLEALETMPVYPGCEEKEYTDKASCTERRMMNFIMSHVIYPEEAIDKNIQGKVFVSFTINKEGFVEQVEIQRGVSESLNNAALTAVGLMPQMKPATKKGKAVDIKYTVPVTFKLTESSTEGNKKKRNKKKRSK